MSRIRIVLIAGATVAVAVAIGGLTPRQASAQNNARFRFNPADASKSVTTFLIGDTKSDGCWLVVMGQSANAIAVSQAPPAACR
jgi:hypothetical protein